MHGFIKALEIVHTCIVISEMGLEGAAGGLSLAL